MAKKSNVDTLLGATDPGNLRHVALGSFLSFFVFFGALLTSDAAISIFTDGQTTMLAAGGEGGESGDDGGYRGDPNYDPGNTGEKDPINDPEWGGTPESRGTFVNPIENEPHPDDQEPVPYPYPTEPLPCYGGTCPGEVEEDAMLRVKTF